MKLLVIIPAFNEAKVIADVIKGLPKSIRGVSKIDLVVVDDGSGDSTGAKARNAGAKVIRHNINRGLGAAIKTGLEFAKRTKIDIAVTFDGDGQHNPQDLEKLIRTIIEKKADVVIGSRFMTFQKIPIDRLIINWFANFITLIFFGAFSTDSQSGLRAFSKKAIENLNLRTDRMAISSEILLEAKRNNLVIMEVPSTAIYTQYSRKKGQKNTNAIPILTRFLVKLLR